MRRRDFLHVAVAGAVALPLLAKVGPATAATPSTAPRASSPTQRDVATLGRKYLRAHRGEADKNALVASLPVADPSRPVLDQMPAWQPAYIDDFAAGQVVAVDGWALSLTEAHAAAAVSLGA
jgi:hypothetical protein